jgi:hypothetical protein
MRSYSATPCAFHSSPKVISASSTKSSSETVIIALAPKHVRKFGTWLELVGQVQPALAANALA